MKTISISIPSPKKDRCKPAPKTEWFVCSCSACGWIGEAPTTWKTSVAPCPECEEPILNLYLLKNQLTDLDKQMTGEVNRPLITTRHALDEYRPKRILEIKKSVQEEMAEYEATKNERLDNKRQSIKGILDRSLRRASASVAMVMLAFLCWVVYTFTRSNATAKSTPVEVAVEATTPEMMQLLVKRNITRFFSDASLPERISKLSIDSAEIPVVYKDMEQNPRRYTLVKESLKPDTISSHDFERGLAQATCYVQEAPQHRLRLFLKRSRQGEVKIDWPTLEQQLFSRFDKALKGEISDQLYRVAVKRTHGRTGLLVPEDKVGISLYDLDATGLSQSLDLVLSDELAKEFAPKLSWNTPVFATLGLAMKDGKPAVEKLICWELAGLGSE